MVRGRTRTLARTLARTFTPNLALPLALAVPLALTLPLTPTLTLTLTRYEGTVIATSGGKPGELHLEYATLEERPRPQPQRTPPSTEVWC